MADPVPFHARPVVTRGTAVPDEARAVGVILARPLFSPDRRPVALAQSTRAVPRLAGLVLAPSLQIALLQTSDAAGSRPQPVSAGGRIAGWQVASINGTGVLLVGYGQQVRLMLKRAGARPIPPRPIEQITIMPTKHTNPQLAW